MQQGLCQMPPRGLVRNRAGARSGYGVHLGTCSGESGRIRLKYRQCYESSVLAAAQSASGIAMLRAFGGGMNKSSILEAKENRSGRYTARLTFAMRVSAGSQPQR